MTDPRNMQAPTGFHQDRSLDRDDLLDDPLAQFRRWLTDAETAGVPLPNAMGVATADADGRPSVRHVLLRGVDDRGFEFFTNYDSRKARELAANPHAGLVFLWKELDRQVNVAGEVSRSSEASSDAYFAARPRDAQLGAWASRQSAVLEDREELERQLAEVAARFPGEVPRPRSGAASSCVRSRSSSGRGVGIGCTTGSATRGRPPATPGTSSASLPEPPNPAPGGLVLRGPSALGEGPTSSQHGEDEREARSRARGRRSQPRPDDAVPTLVR